jgi:Tetratricopeptide repeat
LSIKRAKVNQRLSNSPQVQAVLLVVVALTLGTCMRRSDQDAWLESIRVANDKVKTGNYLEAEDLYLKAKEQCEANFGKQDARTGTCLGYLSELYLGEQEYVKAAITYRSLIEIEKQCAPNSAELERDIREYQFVLAKLKEYGLEETLEQSRANENKILKPEGSRP